jgi:hypothetical protein
LPLARLPSLKRGFARVHGVFINKGMDSIVLTAYYSTGFIGFLFFSFFQKKKENINPLRGTNMSFR